jgi:hypothetical protein
MRLRGFQSSIVLACILTASNAILFSCAGEKKSSGILTHDQMVEVLTDIYVAEQKTSKLSLGTDSSLVVFERLKGKVFQKTGISDSIFKKSYEYYVDRPVELEHIYTALVDSLSLQEQRLDITSYSKEEKK